MTYSEYLKTGNTITGSQYRKWLITQYANAEKNVEQFGASVDAITALFISEEKRLMLELMKEIYELDNGKSE